MRNIAFERNAFDQFNAWATEDEKIYTTIVELINGILCDLFKGLKKLEPLKCDLKG